MFVGAQLWLLRSNSVRKVECRNGLDPSLRVNDSWCGFTRQEMTSPKSRSKGISVVTRGSDSGTQKMKGTATYSPKLDSLEAGATAILQQIGEVSGG